MTRMVKFGVVVVGGLFLAGIMSDEASARPNYCALFISHYSGVSAAKETKCGICHEGQDKKKRNNYGECLTKTLGEKNVKDEAKIKEAFQKAEATKSAVEGKTFGDLLKEGKLPASK